MGKQGENEHSGAWCRRIALNSKPAWAVEWDFFTKTTNFLLMFDFFWMGSNVPGAVVRKITQQEVMWREEGTTEREWWPRTWRPLNPLRGENSNLVRFRGCRLVLKVGSKSTLFTCLCQTQRISLVTSLSLTAHTSVTSPYQSNLQIVSQIQIVSPFSITSQQPSVIRTTLTGL